jgi:hypothetical protein
MAVPFLLLAFAVVITWTLAQIARWAKFQRPAFWYSADHYELETGEAAVENEVEKQIFRELAEQLHDGRHGSLSHDARHSKNMRGLRRVQQDESKALNLGYPNANTQITGEGHGTLSRASMEVFPHARNLWEPNGDITRGQTSKRNLGPRQQRSGHAYEEPLYVNAKQFHRILKRREQRLRLENQLRMASAERVKSERERAEKLEGLGLRRAAGGVYGSGRRLGGSEIGSVEESSTSGTV